MSSLNADRRAVEGRVRMSDCRPIHRSFVPASAIGHKRGFGICGFRGFFLAAIDTALYPGVFERP